MGVQDFEVHDAATLAPDFAALPASKQIDSYTWAGSHIVLEAVLPGTTGIAKGMDICGGCRGRRTLCIYAHYFHHMNESDITLELRCSDCGKFTVHRYRRP